MKLSKGVLILAFCFTVIITALFVLYYGVNDETVDISYRTALLRGDLTSVPISNLFIYFVFISEPLSMLLNYFPTISWVGWQLILLHSFAVIVCIILLVSNLRAKEGSTLLSFLLVVPLTFLLFSESYFYLSIACCSMLGAGASIVLWLYAPFLVKNARQRIAISILCLCTFLLCVLTQNEVTLIALSSCFLYLLICFPDKKRVLKLGGVVAITYLLLYASIHFSTDSYTKEFLRNEKYFFTYYDAYYQNKFVPADNAEKIKEEAMKEWFVWDKSQFNDSFLKKVTAENYGQATSRFDFQKKYSAYINGLYAGLRKRLFPVVILNGLIFFCGIFFLSFNKVLVRRLLLYKISLLVFFSVVCIVLKFEFRILQPILVFDTLFSLLFTVENGLFEAKNKIHFHRLTIFLLLPVLLWGIGWKHHYFKICKAEWVNRLKQSEEFRREINSGFNGQILVTDLSANLPLLLRSPLQTEVACPSNIILGYDAGYSTYYREFDELLLRTCGGDDFKSYMKYLWQQKDKAVFIASPAKVNLWQNYMLQVYRTQVGFSKIKDSDAFRSGNYFEEGKTFTYYRINSFEEIQ